MKLAERTEEKRQEDRQWLIDNCDLNELRRRQELNNKQIEIAHKRKWTVAIVNLREMEADLDAAVLAVTV